MVLRKLGIVNFTFVQLINPTYYRYIEKRNQRKTDSLVLEY